MPVHPHIALVVPMSAGIDAIGLSGRSGGRSASLRPHTTTRPHASTPATFPPAWPAGRRENPGEALWRSKCHERESQSRPTRCGGDGRGEWHR